VNVTCGSFVPKFGTTIKECIWLIGKVTDYGPVIFLYAVMFV